MSDTTDQFASTGKITALKDGIAVFAPRGTNYELHLLAPAGVEVPLHTPVDVRIRCSARNKLILKLAHEALHRPGTGFTESTDRAATRNVIRNLD